MELVDAVKALASLAQETRLEVFRLVIRSGDEGLAAGSIAEQLAVPASTLSFHLKELCNAGLLQDRRDGRSIYYSLKSDAMRELISFLVDDCCAGRPELCALTPAAGALKCC